MLLVIVLIRHNDNKKPHRTKIKIGEINESKDKIEPIDVLLKKIYIGLSGINVNSEGGYCMSLDSMCNVNFDATFNTSKCIFKFCIIGDLKGLFQTSRRSGFDSSYCLCCNFRPKCGKNTQNQVSLFLLRHGLWTLLKRW